MAGFVYLRSEPGLWTVGFYTPTGEWIAESDHDHTPDAATWGAYLTAAARPGAIQQRRSHEYLSHPRARPG